MSERNENAQIALVVVAGLLVLLVLSEGKKAVNEILAGIGLGDDKSDKGAAAASNKVAPEVKSWTAKVFRPKEFFRDLDAKYPPSKNPLLLANGKKIEVVAAAIYNSVTWTGDDSRQGLAAFKNLTTKASVAQLAEYFLKKYNRDLLAYITEHYDTDAQQINFKAIIDYVDGLPLGIYLNGNKQAMI